MSSSGCGYGKFKPAVGEAVIETLRPIREEAARILADKAYLESVYKAGAEKASYTAAKTLRKVYKRWASWPADPTISTANEELLHVVFC